MVALDLFAGMPSVTLSDAASLRLQSISFFLLVFLIAALLIRWIWNSLRSDFPRLPHLSYPKAIGLMTLWGLLFLVVLTMISGARELMTPGAWKKDGLTYTLDVPPKAVPPAEPTESARRDKLHLLFAALAGYAAKHEGRFPPANDPTIPGDRWQTPHASGIHYLYRADCKPGEVNALLACEPAVFEDGRFVLFAGGDIKRMTSDEVVALLSTWGKP